MGHCTPNLRDMLEVVCDESAKASASSMPKTILVNQRVGGASKGSSKSSAATSERKSTASVPANAQKTQFRRDANVAPADQYARVCAEMSKLKKEVMELKKSIYVDAQAATPVLRNKKVGVLKDSKTLVPSTLYCTYVYDDDDAQKNAECVAGQHNMPNAKMLPIDALLVHTQLYNTHTMPGFVSLHKSNMQIEEQGKNTENVIYAGLLHFPVPWLAQAKIGESITNGMSPTKLLDTHPEFASAKNAAFLLCDYLQATNPKFDPVCWCTGADGFCVVWYDTACFLRHKKHKVQIRTRCVDVFLQSYLDAATYAGIADKFDLFSCILNIQHAALCSYRCLASPVEATPLQLVAAPEHPPNLTQEMILRTKLATFWHFLLTKIPMRNSIVGLPMAVMPKAVEEAHAVPQ